MEAWRNFIDWCRAPALPNERVRRAGERNWARRRRRQPPSPLAQPPPLPAAVARHPLCAVWRFWRHRGREQEVLGGPVRRVHRHDALCAGEIESLRRGSLASAAAAARTPRSSRLSPLSSPHTVRRRGARQRDCLRQWPGAGDSGVRHRQRVGRAPGASAAEGSLGAVRAASTCPASTQSPLPLLALHCMQNPAVTLGTMISGHMAVGKGLAYIAAQLLGGCVGERLLAVLQQGGAEGAFASLAGAWAEHSPTLLAHNCRRAVSGRAHPRRVSRCCFC